MCYTSMGAVVPVQRMPKAERGPAERGPFSPHSPSRAKSSHVFQSRGAGGLPLLGGLPFRKILSGSKFLPNHEIKPTGTPAGLPYALGQLLLEKSREDREAADALPKTLTFEERAYGAESLEAPKKAKGDEKAIENKSGKASAKVAPAS
jgi:hypothetical protein